MLGTGTLRAAVLMMALGSAAALAQEAPAPTPAAPGAEAPPTDAPPTDAPPAVPAAPEPPAPVAPDGAAPAPTGVVDTPSPPPIAELPPPPPPPPEEDELPIPTLKIDRIPPSYSYEFAVQFGYGDIAYWRNDVPWWISFGVRGGWGKNFGPHRLGADAVQDVEGPSGVHMTTALEPHLAWDFISQKGFAIGAGAGPAFMYHARARVAGPETAYTVAPALVGRIGWSQTWSRIGRRLFVFLEPRVRYSPTGDSKDQPFSPGVVLAAGSGRGY